MKIAVFGLGYVGAVTAACLAAPERTVVGVDPDYLKVEIIRAGRSPVVEPLIDDRVATATSQGWLRATTDAADAMQGADVALLCVGTPSRLDGSSDLRFIERAVVDVAENLQRCSSRPVVVVRSTVPPGTVSGVVADTIERVSGRTRGEHFAVAMCPEFLREGSSVADFFDPPFTVIGTDDEGAEEVLRDLFSFIDAPLHAVSIKTAEALKYSCNAFHAVKVSFANELGRLFQSLGIDSREVMRLFVEDTRLNISKAYLRPGFAFGGSCLPKDLRSLLHMARINGVDVPLLSSTIATNDLVIRNLVRDVLSSGSRSVALLGISFKPQTDDLRESPYVELAEMLLGKGVELTIYDPIVRPEKLFGANLAYVERHLPHLQKFLVDTPEEAIQQSGGCVIVATPHDSVCRALRARTCTAVYDLVGTLGDEIEQQPGYRGVSWG